MQTLRVRIKDKHAKVLNALACDVNLVWNYCNDLRTGKFFSSYDLQKYTAGARDVNAAKNILRRGHATLAGGITVSSGR